MRLELVDRFGNAIPIRDAQVETCVICLRTARYRHLGALYNKLTLLRTVLSVAGQPVCRSHKKCERAHKEARVNALSDNHWLRRQKARVSILPCVHLSRRHCHRRFIYGISLVKFYRAEVQGTL